MEQEPLRELVSSRVDRRWEAFAREHPNLAAAIDRIELVEQAVRNLRHDPRYVDAMRAADLDDAQLARAAEALERLDQVVTLVLPR